MNIDKVREEILSILQAGTEEIAPPPNTPAEGPCRIPERCIFRDGDRIDILNIYTTVGYKGFPWPRHQLAAYYQYGHLAPEGHQVMHHCDRKSCCSTKHVRYGNDNVQEAVDRRLLLPPKPEYALKGQKNGNARMSDEDAATIKWLWEFRTQWFFGEIAAAHTVVEAIAIFLDVTVPMVKRTKLFESWRGIVPKRPPLLPDINSVPADAKPRQPERHAKISDQIVVMILRRWWAITDRRHFVRDIAKELKISGVAVLNILKGKTAPDVRPEIPRVISALSGNIVLSDKQVQAIRTTWQTWTGPKVGLAAALARWCGSSKAHVRAIIMRWARPEVPDDPSAAILRDELEFKQLTQRGSNHRLSKVTEEQVLYALRAKKAGVTTTSLALELDLSWTRMHLILTGHGFPDAQARFREEQRQFPESSAAEVKNLEDQP